MSLVGHKDEKYGLHTLIMIYYVVAVHCKFRQSFRKPLAKKTIRLNYVGTEPFASDALFIF